MKSKARFGEPLVVKGKQAEEILEEIKRPSTKRQRDVMQSALKNRVPDKSDRRSH